MNLSSENLIKELKKGNEKIFDGIFREYYQGLCMFGNQYIHNISITEEIVQDVFLKIWEKRNLLEPHSSFKTYLYTSVRNGCIDYIRKEKVKNKYADRIKEQEQSFIKPEDIPDKHIINEIKKAINTLPTQRRKIFRMNRFLGLKYKEIAEKLNLSPKTVENQMGIALKQLREILKKHIPVILLFFCKILNLL